MILLAILFLSALAAFGGEQFSYVYKPAGADHTIAAGSVDTIVRVARKYSGTYFWTERNGRQYLIRDAAVLGEIDKTLEPLEAASRPLEALHRRMHPVEKRAERLERQIDDLEDDDRHDAELERQLRALNRELAEYEREESRLDRLQEQAERRAEAALLIVVDRAIRNGIAKRVR